MRLDYRPYTYRQFHEMFGGYIETTGNMHRELIAAVYNTQYHRTGRWYMANDLKPGPELEDDIDAPPSTPASRLIGLAAAMGVIKLVDKKEGE